MPSTSDKMRKASAIALHHPDKLFKRNRGMLEMSQEQLHDFASTPESSIKKSMKGILGKGKS